MLVISFSRATDCKRHLDVVDVGEEDLQDLEELRLVARQRLTGEDFQEIPEVVTGVEREPHDVVEQDDAGGREQRRKLDRVDAIFFVLFKLNPGVPQQVDTVLRVHVLTEREELSHGIKNKGNGIDSS